VVVGGGTVAGSISQRASCCYYWLIILSPITLLSWRAQLSLRLSLLCRVDCGSLGCDAVCRVGGSSVFRSTRRHHPEATIQCRRRENPTSQPLFPRLVASQGHVLFHMQSEWVDLSSWRSPVSRTFSFFVTKCRLVAPYPRVCPPPNNFWTSWRIFMKIGVNIMPLEVTPLLSCERH
jgi:hypothetical protein